MQSTPSGGLKELETAHGESDSEGGGLWHHVLGRLHVTGAVDWGGMRAWVAEGAAGDRSLFLPGSRAWLVVL